MVEGGRDTRVIVLLALPFGGTQVQTDASPSLPVSRQARGLPALHVACCRTHHTSTPFRYPAVTSLGWGPPSSGHALYTWTYIYIYNVHAVHVSMASLL